MKSNKHILEPRGLNREQASLYIGVGMTKFDELVDKGMMPKPKMIGARKVYDRFAINVAFDQLPDDSGNEWDEVLGV